MSIVKEWEIRTRGVVPRSPELRKLDASVSVWALQGQGIRDVNMANVSRDLIAWKTAKPAEYARIQIFAQQLADEITKMSPKPAQLAAVKATTAQSNDYRLFAPGSPNYELDGDNMLPAAKQLPPLTTVEIHKINEAVRRVRLAVEVARDIMIQIAKSAALGTTPEEKLYFAYFGAFDSTRAKKVLTNYKNLCIAMGGAGPIVFDHRNTDFGVGCFAAAHRGTVTVDVKIWLGRAFFKPYAPASEEAYQNSSDNTVGTLIHEFSHACFSAVDAPRLLPITNDFEVPHNADWSSTTNSIQTSTREMDKRLAHRWPDAAVVNADNYGQFACEAILMRGK